MLKLSASCVLGWVLHLLVLISEEKLQGALVLIVPLSFLLKLGLPLFELLSCFALDGFHQLLVNNRNEGAIEVLSAHWAGILT